MAPLTRVPGRARPAAPHRPDRPAHRDPGAQQPAAGQERRAGPAWTSPTSASRHCSTNPGPMPGRRQTGSSGPRRPQRRHHPGGQRDRLQRLLHAGIDFPLVYVAHEIPKGRSPCRPGPRPGQAAPVTLDQRPRPPRRRAGSAARRDQRAGSPARPQLPAAADRPPGRPPIAGAIAAAPVVIAPRRSWRRRRRHRPRGRPRPHRLRRHPGRRPGTRAARRLVHPRPMGVAGRARRASGHVTLLTEPGNGALPEPIRPAHCGAGAGVV